MKTIIKNKLRMYNAVNRVIVDNLQSWSGLPAFQNAYNTFADKLTELKSLKFEKSQLPAGLAAEKNLKRKEVKALVIPVAKALKSHAIQTEDTPLKRKMSFPPSRLVAGSQAETMNHLNAVIQATEDHLQELGMYNITQQELDALIEAKNQLEEMFLMPRNTIIYRSQLVRNIDRLVEEMDALLRNRLDMVIELLRASEIGFYESYNQARIILDYRATRNSGEEPGTAGPGTLSP